MSRSRTAMRWLGYLGIAILFAVACAFLANWQFTRNAERADELALIDRNYDAAPVPYADALAEGAALGVDDEWQPVVLVGEYLVSDQVLVRNRAHGGTSAFEVLVPFETTDGRVIVVDRGWVPPGEDQPEPDAVPGAPQGEVTVVARLRHAEPVPASGRSAPDGQVPTINTDLVAAQTGLDGIDDGVYAVMVSETPAPAERPNALTSPSEDPGPHLSYAIQWILFAIMGFAFIGYIIRTEMRHRREDADDQAPLTPRRGRRRDRDAEDEDAILDRAGV